MKRLLFCVSILFLSLASIAQQTISPEWLWELGRVGVLDVSENHNTILYQVRKYNVAENNSKATIYTMTLDGKKNRVFHDNVEYRIGGLAFHPNQDKITYLKDGKLHMMNLDGSGKQQLLDIPMNAYKVSPDGKHVAYTYEVAYGKTLKETYSQYPKANALVYDDLMYRHWDDYEDNKYSNLFIASIDGKGSYGSGKNITPVPHDTPLNPFGGMEQISWNHNGSKIYYTMKKLSGKDYAVSTNSDIYAYDITTMTEENVTKANKGYDMEPVCSSDGRYLVYNSMKTPGYESDKNRAILLDLRTGARTIINESVDMNANHPSFSPDNKLVYFGAGVEATNQLFSYNIKTKKIKQITEGVHNVNGFTPIKRGVITTINSMTDAAEIFHVSKRGKINQLTHVNKALYDKVTKATVTSKWVKTTDGKQMKVWYILPPNFDKNKKYPTLLYCQGGPQSAVSQFFSYRWNFQLMASQGYVIVAPNRRGLPSFGEEWNKQISRDWGGQAMRDYLSAIDDAVATEPYVDKDRLGAIGASYGGYSVYWLAGNHDKRFKSFISHCGLFNLESWYGTTEELFFANQDIGGPYWDNSLKEEYKKFSPHTYADKWDTPILVIHGEKDYRVPIQEGMQAYQLAQLKGLKSKFLVFPDEGHWILSPQNAMIWQKEFFNWLDETVKNIPTK